MDDKFFEDARDTFVRPGWKAFVEEVSANVNSIRVEHIEDEKNFWMAKGQLQVLHQILGYENYVHHLERQQEEDDAQDF